MIIRALACFGVLLMSFSLNLQANDSPLPFVDKVQEVRFKALAEELRCLVCQNQSLADSNAVLAQDLKEEVLKLMQQGLSDGEIIEFLTSRYGDFILYRPPLKNSTLFLWLAPLLFLIAGSILAVRLIYPKNSAAKALPQAVDEPTQFRERD